MEEKLGMRRFKLLSFLFLILLVLFVNLGSSYAISRGDYLKEETEGNKKEEQLLRKIEIIHETFGSAIDEEALYATLVHRGTLTDYIEDSYDEDFDEEEFKDVWNDIKLQFDAIISSSFDMAQYMALSILAGLECLVEEIIGEGTEDEHVESYYEENCVLNKVIDKYVETWEHSTDIELEAQIKKPKTIDLLTAATIVMLDSSSWVGTYSDENYEKALAGEGLVGNIIDRSNPITNFIGIAYNGVFCTIRNVADIAISATGADTLQHDFFDDSPLNLNHDLSDLDGFSGQDLAMANRLSRFYTMDKICSLGFIGGTYQHVQNPDVSTEEGKERYQQKKDIVAEQIIGLAQDLRASGGLSGNNCVVNPSSSGAFATWKQYDPAWASISLGGVSNMKNIGCLVTALAIQFARSGTQISNLPNGYTSFNPGAFVTTLSQNGGFDGGGGFRWTGYQSIAPNVKFMPAVHVNINNVNELATTLAKELSTPAEGKYQKFIVMRISHNSSSQHWVAVDTVTGNQVTILDPGAAGKTLDENYSGWTVHSYRVMYATDVLQGQTGTSTGGTGNYCETSGSIVIPEEYGGGGYTVTVYNDFNWAYDQGKVYDLWAAAGSQWDDGIAVIDGRYLIACTKKFGNVGDKVDFYLDDGTKIPAIIADIKNESDSGANEWGHNNGQNVLEFEVSHLAFYSTYNRHNPGTNGWHMEWAGKRVSSATNLGENIIA